MEQIIDVLRNVWGNPRKTRKVTWPLVLRVGVEAMAQNCRGGSLLPEFRTLTAYPAEKPFLTSDEVKACSQAVFQN